MKASVALWTLWYVYWIVSARRRVRNTDGATITRESWIGRLGYMGLMLVGFVLLFWRPAGLPLDRNLLPSSRLGTAVGLTVQTVGLAFAIWARQTLGSNWAGRITIGGSQELVIKGPYRIVRHPIYSGLLLGVLGTAIIEGQVRGLIGVLFVFAGVAIKLRREETALRQHFGGAYEEYAKRVPGVVPLRWG